MWIIYVARNRINGKRYVGATGKTLVHRRKRHVYDANHGKAYCRVFHAAIRKYGIEAFDWSILTVCKTIDEAMATEKHLIKELKPEYNISAGGRGIVGVSWSSERRIKILATMVGRKRTPEQIARMKAVPHDFAFKPIVCLQERKLFDSIVGAAAFYGIPKGRISSVLRGESTQTGGRSFIFAKEVPSEVECEKLLESLETRRQSEDQKRAVGKRKRPLLCLETGERFESANDAAVSMGFSPARISQACLDGDALKGKHFMYADMDAPVVKSQRTAEQIARQKAGSLAGLKKAVTKTRKQVIRLDNNMVFDSITEAAKSVGAHVASVSDAIHRNGTSKGVAFCFFDEWCPNPL